MLVTLLSETNKKLGNLSQIITSSLSTKGRAACEPGPSIPFSTGPTSHWAEEHINPMGVQAARPDSCSAQGPLAQVRGCSAPHDGTVGPGITIDHNTFCHIYTFKQNYNYKFTFLYLSFCCLFQLQMWKYLDNNRSNRSVKTIHTTS